MLKCVNAWIPFERLALDIDLTITSLVVALSITLSIKPDAVSLCKVSSMVVSWWEYFRMHRCKQLADCGNNMWCLAKQEFCPQYFHNWMHLIEDNAVWYNRSPFDLSCWGRWKARTLTGMTKELLNSNCLHKIAVILASWIMSETNKNNIIMYCTCIVFNAFKLSFNLWRMKTF